jgi:hypothetical protein
VTGSGRSEVLKYASGERGNSAETLRFRDSSLGQWNPQHCPQSAESTSQPPRSPAPLGDPLTIDGVAELLGCSPWTIRQRYLRQGLPHLQASARGKLIFFREQIIAWVEKRQRRKGGLLR